MRAVCARVLPAPIVYATAWRHVRIGAGIRECRQTWIRLRVGSPPQTIVGGSIGNPGNTCPSSGLESTNDGFWRYSRAGPGGG